VTPHEAHRQQAADTCAVCGHYWTQHDPEDGRCDSHSIDGSVGVCQCGRDLAFQQKWNAYLSRMALGRLHSPEDTA
jgi:hypothetical protein